MRVGWIGEVGIDCRFLHLREQLGGYIQVGFSNKGYIFVVEK